MSVDLSDPQVTAARQAIADPSDPTSWFLLHYAPGTSPSPLAQSITLLEAGPSPVLPSWQEHLNATTENVLFGFGEIGGKGLVLVFLRESVGGVKRGKSRAVVHSRAIASLFPDYSAIITISYPSELTEDLITDRLGLTAPSPAPVPKYTVPGADTPDPLAPKAAGVGRALPKPPVTPEPQSQAAPATGGAGAGVESVPEGTVSPPPRGASLGMGLPNAAGVGAGGVHTQKPRNGSLPPHAAVANGDKVQPSLPSPRRVPVPASLTDLPTHTPASPASSQPSPSRQPPPEVKPVLSGISSAEYFKDDPNRMRKSSLTSRLKNTFHRSTPSVEEAPSTPPSAHSPLPTSGSPAPPTSPSSGRFKASSLGKVFGKKRASAGGADTAASPPTSPKMDEFGASFGAGDGEYRPPVPPKDARRSASASASSLPGVTNAGVYGEHRPRFDSNGAATRSSAATLGHDGASLNPPSPSDPRSAALSPSPSARQALYDARQKSVEQEAEIQERFRRDQEEKLARARAVEGRQVEDDEESVRLAYDESDTDDERARAGARATASAVELGQPIVVAPAPETREVVDGEGAVGSPSLSNDTPLAEHPPAEHISVLAEQHAQREAALRAEETKVHDLAAQEAATRDLAEQQRLEEERLAAKRKLEEDRKAEESRVEIQKLRLEAEEEERQRQATETRLREKAEVREREAQHERERLEAEAAAEAAAKVEAERQARVAEEEEAARRAHEARLAEEEAARVAAEEEARRAAQEQERLRAEEEVRAREAAVEQERLRVEEEARAKREAEERAVQEQYEAEQQKLEAEQARKADIRAQLANGKTGGGVMLRGWVTVQTYKSMTWRRRHFLLLPTEMQLFKNEGDEKPIQTIFFGPGSSVSERYEESQVKDSFKVLSVGPKGEEEFFLFTDSAEDKETVLEGLRLCLA
ncbi:hypothetical protein IAT38_003075 [Cryptococcus sp. DSM 104549]